MRTKIKIYPNKNKPILRHIVMKLISTEDLDELKNRGKVYIPLKICFKEVD